MAKRDAAPAEDVPAPHGEKMIEVRVRFFTNGIAAGKDHIRRKHAWAQGMVSMERNDTHGIGTGEPVAFNSLMGVPRAIEEALIANGVRLHSSDRERRYYVLPPKGPTNPST